MDYLNADLAVIEKLSDSPNADGLTAAELKAKFDEAALIIQKFINEKIVPEIIGLSDGAGSSFLAKTGGTISGNLNVTGAMAVTAPTSDDHAATKYYVDEAIRTQRIIAKNVSVSKSGWNNGSGYADFPVYKDISITGVTNSHIPVVCFNVPQATSGDYAPFAVTLAGKVRIFAASYPSADFTIPNIICWKG